MVSSPSILSAEPQHQAGADAKFRVKKIPLVKSWLLIMGRLPGASEFPQLLEYWESTQPFERP